MSRRTKVALLLVTLAFAAFLSLSTTPAVSQAARLELTPDGNGTTAGTPLTVTITAYLAGDNVDTGYSSTVHFTSSDAAATLPRDYTFVSDSDNGSHTFTDAITLRASGNQTVTVTDNAALTHSTTWTVAPAPAAGLEVSGPPAVTAGATSELTITARDPYGNIATSYSGSKWLTFSGLQNAPSGSAPSVEDVDMGMSTPVTFTSGVSDTAAVTFIAYAAEATTLAVSDGNISSSGSPNYALNLTVNPAPAAGLDLTPGSGSTGAGSPLPFAVTAYDAYGNTATSYVGTVLFTSSDPSATLPTPHAFTSSERGFHAFAATLRTSGDQTIVVTDNATPTLTDTASRTVSASTIDHYTVTSDSYTQVAGAPFVLSVTVCDPFNNAITTDNTTAVTLSSTSNTMLFDGDRDGTFGEATDNVVMLRSRSFTVEALDTTAATGTTITATDPSSVTGTSSAYTLVPAGTVHHYTVTSESYNQTAGEIFTVTVTAYDAFGNITNNSASVTLISTSSTMLFDGNGNDILGEPDDNLLLLSSGIGTIFAGDTVANAGLTITATDNNSTSGTSSPYAINAGALDHLTITSTSYGQTAGVAFTLTVSTFDPFDNLVSIDNSTWITLTSNSVTMLFDGNSNGTFGEPGDNVVTLSSGTRDVAAMDTTAASGIVITATTTDSRTASSPPYVITADASIDHYTVTSDTYTQQVTVSFLVIVTACDASGNLVPADNVTVTIGSSLSTLTFDGNGNGIYGEAGDNTGTLERGCLRISAKPTSTSTGLVITATDINTRTGVSQTYTVEDFRCFIATAAWGTPMVQQIQVLRDFRDEYLMTNPVGRLFVSTYYRCSPPFARFIARHDSLRAIVRVALTPVLWCATILMNTTCLQKIAFLLAMIAFGAASVLSTQRLRQSRTQ